MTTTTVSTTNHPVPAAPVTGGSDPLALAWHDETCPEGEQCRSRSLHAMSAAVVTSGILGKVLTRTLTADGLTIPSVVRDGVRQFHLALGHAVRTAAVVDVPERALRLRMLREEMRELHDAVAVGDVVEVADALGDIVYLAYGDSLVYGIDLDVVVAEIQRSNMTKLGPNGERVYRADGKSGKPATFSPTQIAQVMGLDPVPAFTPMPDALPELLRDRLDLWDSELLSTATQLDALPKGTVVIDELGHTFTKGATTWWCVCGDEPAAWGSGELLEECVEGPLRILWRKPQSD